ncbi:SGNH/GDSL hydrolase family protein [Amnibacterium kyonggiense]
MNAARADATAAHGSGHHRRMLHLSRRTAVIVGAASVVTLGATVPPRVLFVLGDSWAAGLYADPAHALGQVASARLGWRASVDAVSGTGYVNGAAAGISYPDRLGARTADPSLGIAVLQGGSNDQGAPAATIAAAATETLSLLRDRLPAARPVMLGPGPDPLPVTRQQTAVDRVLQEVAARADVPYVSMLQRRWITGRRADAVIDPDDHHPTVAGQEYLGLRLASALRHLYPRLTA